MIWFLVAFAAIVMAGAIFFGWLRRRCFPNALNHPDRDRGEIQTKGILGVLVLVLVVLAILYLVGINVNLG